MRLRFGVFLLTFFFITTATAATGADTLRTFFAQATSMKAEFEQAVLSDSSIDIQRSHGTMMLERPGKFRWNYASPYEQVIVGDGDKIWIYDVDLDQVTVKKQDEALANTPAELLSSDTVVDYRFDINELGEQDGMLWVELMPKQSEAAFQVIRLAFRAGNLAAMEMEDALGNQTLLRFDSIEKNPALASDTFVFTPPPGVDVVGP